MNKKDIVKKIAADIGIPQVDVENVINGLAEVVGRELNQTGKADVPGVCKINIRQRAARTGRNPKTGQPVSIPASRAIKFKALAPLNEWAGIEKKSKAVEPPQAS